jgi:hypothetical protein
MQNDLPSGSPLEAFASVVMLKVNIKKYPNSEAIAMNQVCTETQFFFSGSRKQRELFLIAEGAFPA